MTLESDIAEVFSGRRPGPRSGYALPALAVGGIAAIATALGGFGVRLGWWDSGTGFTIVRMMLWGGVTAGALGAIALSETRPGRQQRGFVPALFALLLSFFVIRASLGLRRAQAELPRIADVTTDVMNPPAFVKIAELRSPSDNPVDYPGESVARIQETTYGEVQPILIELPHYDAYLHAIAKAEESGWEVVDANERDGRIEATTRTSWFGFREDITVRLTAVGARTVVDVRSASRDRDADLGSNARRIRDYLELLATD